MTIVPISADFQKGLPLIVKGVTYLQALMNYSAYAPLAKLRRVLEEKGFCKKSDRPTLLQV
jgi:hypothetical protein